MDRSGLVTVRMLGKLHSLRRAAGLESTAEVAVPPAGTSARQIAVDLGLPLDEIEAVFRNRSSAPLSETVYPGDRLAFVPRGTPGPHRFTLGIYSAGREG